jgi:hypothetical protein
MRTLLRWKRQWGGSDRIVWVVVSKLDAAWKRDGTFYLPTHTHDYKYLRFDAWIGLNASTEKVEMPHVGVHEGVASFSDGRHRFAWFRDHGVKAMPVTTCGASQIREIRRAFESRSRKCFL